MKVTFKQRQVEITDVELEIGEYARAIEARFLDTGELLSDSEIDDLNDICAGEIYENAYSDMASRAYDRAKDFRKYGDL